MRYEDDFFGDGAGYVAKYKASFNGEVPSYVAAGASAAGWTVMKAIQSAYADAAETITEISMDLVKDALKKQKVTSFFGDIEYNKWNRNEAKDPATMQLLPDPSSATKIYTA